MMTPLFRNNSTGGLDTNILKPKARAWRLSRRVLCANALFFVSMAVSAAQTLDQYTVLSALTLNFARFTQWPAAAFAQPETKLRVCLVGDNVVQEAFESVDGKTVQDRTLEVVNAQRLKELEKCQILFISELPKNLLLQVFVDLKNRPVLTIGEDESFVEAGGMVGMINTDGKINLHVNLPAARASGLSIDPKLLRLAKIVGK